MAMRYFNWKLAIVLIVAIGVFGVAVFSLHRWQRSTKAEQALPRGQKAFELKKWDEAADQLGRYIAVNNQDVAVLIRYAQAQMNRRPMTQGNIQMAIAAYRNALRFKPDDMDTARRLSQLYLDMGAPTEALEIAERHLQRQDDPALRRTLGEAQWRLREFDKAVAEMKTVIAKYPGEIAAYEFLGVTTELRPEAADRPAATWFDEAVTKNPDSALAHAVRAAYRLRHNEKGQAMTDLTRALECDLSDMAVRLRVVRELVNAGAWEQARQQLQAAQAADKAEPRLWQAWADLAVKSGSQEEMYTVAEEGMKAMEGEAWDFISVATHLLIMSGHLDKVGEYLSQMRGKDLDPPTVAYLEGLLAEKQGRLRDAVASWQQAISLGSRTPEDVYVRLASALARLGDTQSAITQLQIMLSKRPAASRQSLAGLPQQSEYVHGHLFLTQLFAQVRNWPKVQESAKLVQQLAGGDPNDPVVMEATLLELQARTHLLGGTAAETGQQAWRDIETRLAELDKTSKGAVAVKLLQIQVAMAQEKFADASTLLTELEGKHPSDLRLMLLHADLCMAQGRDDEAKTQLQKAVAAFPQASDPVQGLALFLDRQNQRAECEAVIKDALTRIQEPQSQARRDLSLLLSEFYRRWQEQEKRCSWLTEVAAQFPNDIQPRRLLLACEPVMKDADRSQKIIDEIKALEGEKGSQWRYEQARLWMQAGDFKVFKVTYPQIVKVLQENLLTNPEDQASRLLLAGCYEMAGEQQLALTTYREAFSRTPNDTQVLVRLIAALHKANEFDEAQSILDKVGQQNLSNPDLQRLQVDSDFRRGDLTSAQDTLQQLVERDPNDTTLRLSYARVLILRREFAKAEAVLADLRAKQPESIPVIRAQIRLYVQQGNNDKAMQVCNETVDTLHDAAAYLLRAEMLITVQQVEKALEDLAQAIKLEPQNVGTWEARARVYSVMGRIADAIPDVRRALELASKGANDLAQREAKARIQKLAVALFIASGSQSLLREAESLLDKALGDRTNPQDKSDPELGLYKARILILRGTGPAIEEARQRLRQITTDFPKYTDAWEVMAQLELQQEEPGRALDHATRGLAHVDYDPKTGEPVKSEQSKRLLLLKAIAEKRISPSVAALTTLPKLANDYPNDIGVLIEWADAYARANRPEKAVELLNGKLADFTGTARRRCEIALAAALYTDQQQDKAKTLFDTLIAAEPNDPTPVMTLGQLLRKEKRWTEVNQLLNRWRTTNPKDAETSTSMARILAGSGDKEALQMAEDQLRMILDPNPASVPTLVLLGMLMQDAERTDEATRLNRRILELDPNNVIAINNLAWMLCEQPSPSPAAIKEALDLANRGLTLIPDYVDLLDTRGVVNFRAGDLAKSEADLVKCLTLFPANSPQSAAPHFHLARTYAALNRRTEAVQDLKIALNLNGRNVQVARDHADAGRRTHAIKVLKDALSLQEQMDQFKTGFDQQDLVGIRSAGDWTEARLLLDQLQKGLK